MRKSKNQKRMEEFANPVRAVPDSVYIHPQGVWEYIPIHPFADEPEILDRLQIRPIDCQCVDAWCSNQQDATLTEAVVAQIAKRPVGLYARQTDNQMGWVYLTMVVEAPFITRSIFEWGLVQFSNLEFPVGDSFKINPDDGMVRIGDYNQPKGRLADNTIESRRNPA